MVATDIRGCRQVVDDGITGLRVPVRNATSLATAIDRLVSDGALRSRFGDAARDKALRSFDDREVVRRTLDAYAMLDS